MNLSKNTPRKKTSMPIVVPKNTLLIPHIILLFPPVCLLHIKYMIVVAKKKRDHRIGFPHSLFFIRVAIQKAIAVLSPEIQMVANKSSTPSFLAIKSPPPTVPIHTGQLAYAGFTKNIE